MTILSLMILSASFIICMICFSAAVKRFPICDNAPVKYWLVSWGLMILGVLILAVGVVQFIGIDTIVGVL